MSESKNRQTDRGARRSGWIIKGTLFAVGAVAVSGLVFLTSFLPKFSWGGSGEKPLTYQVVRGEFVSEVLERGDVESASNVEIRCEVESQGSGVMILRIVPEGTYVQPGDFLVELDSSSLRDRFTQQQITVANARANLIQAQNVLDTARIAKQEYLEGQYRQQLLAIQIENFVAQENKRRAEDYLKYSQSLAQKGYITQAQLEADRFALERAEKDVESARTKLDVLERFTKPKMLKQLDADIQTAQAKFEAQQHALELEEQELKEIEDQIAKCTITAPEAGQVVYANQVGVRGQTDIIIQEGVRVRERQTIIRLPDPKRMRVKTKVNESKIGLVAEGLPAQIQVDALANQVFEGQVVDVGEYPLPTSFFNSNVKDYEVIVRIDNPTEQLRAGLTAQVRIVSHREPNVLQVPVQAVFEYAKKFYLPATDRWHRMSDDNFSGARELTAWKKHIETHWKEVHVLSATTDVVDEVKVGQSVHIQVPVHLGALSPKDVRVQVLYGSVNPDGDLIAPNILDLTENTPDADSRFVYSGEITCHSSGLQGFAVRVIPCHESLSYLHETGLIRWG